MADSEQNEANRRQNGYLKDLWDSVKSGVRTAKFFMELAALVVVILYTIFARGQLKQMIESNRINREALDSVQRAFVNFQSIGIVKRVSVKPSDISWDIFVNWQNSGGTQALHALQLFRACILPGEPNEQLFKEAISGKAAYIYIAPKATQQTGYVNKEESFLPVSGPIPPNQQRFFWGWIFYQDIFSNEPINSEPHVTEFCAFLSRWGISAANGSPTFDYNACPSHNCADKDCEDYNDIVQMVANKTNAETPAFRCPTQPQQ
jgi:hypothetical protein